MRDESEKNKNVDSEKHDASNPDREKRVLSFKFQ